MGFVKYGATTLKLQKNAGYSCVSNKNVNCEGGRGRNVELNAVAVF